MEVWTLAMTLVSPGRKRSKSWSFLARYYLLTRLADVDFIASGSWKDRAHCLDFPQERPTGSLLSWGNDQVSEKLQHDFCYYYQSMISSALVKEKPETVPAGFVSEAFILRSELISYNSNSFRINCRSVTKAERTHIGFPENFRHSAIFGKVRG